MSDFNIGTGAEPATSYNRPIIGLLGQYTLAAGTNVPYISAALEIERVVKELKAFDQIPPSLSATWSLRELFQRDIDYDRIEREIVNGYLKSANKIKFFNALTFVFFPKSADGAFQEVFEAYDGNNPVIPHPEVELDRQFAADARVVAFGGVQLAMKGIFARVRWDDNRVAAIAVDGQHRLTALRKWWESKQQTLTIDEKRTRVPVLFLLLHKDAGFESPNGGKSLRQVARDIFTDLNKHAREVDEAREIILDDKSFEAECVRRLVTNDTCRDSSDQLPLSLIRWQDPNHRFDSKYFLNSLLNLHQLVRLAVPAGRITNPLEVDSVRAYIKRLGECLYGVADKLAVDGMSLLAHYEDKYVVDEDADDFRPFVHLPPKYLSAAVEQFSCLHKPYIVAATTQIKPYKELLDYARARGLIVGQFSQYNAQPASHKKELLPKLELGDPEWVKNHIDAHERAIESIKRVGREDETWCFKAIFQKALVRLFREIVFVNGGDADTRERLGATPDLIKFLDSIYDAGLLNLNAKLPGADGPLWAGIGVRFNDARIKVNKTVEESIFALLLLGYFASRKFRYDESLGRAPTQRASELARYFSQQQSGSESVTSLWPKADEAYDKLVVALGKESPSWRRMSDDRERRKEMMNSEGKKRLASLMAAFAIEYQFADGASD
jgi:hypothetical protein